MPLLIWNRMTKKYDTHAKVEGLFETKRIALYDENHKKGKDAPPFIETVKGGIVIYRLPAIIFLEMDEEVGFTELGSVLKPVLAVELSVPQSVLIKKFFKEGQ